MYVQLYFANERPLSNIVANRLRREPFQIDALGREAAVAAIAITIQQRELKFPRFRNYITSNSCSQSKLIKRLL